MKCVSFLNYLFSSLYFASLGSHSSLFLLFVRRTSGGRQAKKRETVWPSALFSFNRPGIPDGVGRSSPWCHISAAVWGASPFSLAHSEKKKKRGSSGSRGGGGGGGGCHQILWPSFICQVYCEEPASVCDFMKMRSAQVPSADCWSYSETWRFEIVS